MTYPDGRKFVGEFTGDTRKKGVLTWPNGKIYEGNFVASKMSGQGVLKYADGVKFVGRFANDERVEGEETETNGTIIKAKYKNDMKEGKDCRIYLTNNIVLTGPFVNNELHGRVTVKHPNGKIEYANYNRGKKEKDSR